MIGYLHPGYPKSLVEFGNPRKLTLSGGWILERQIPGTPYQDAMGCYPLFICDDWSRLYSDLYEISNELVSLVVVTDPFGEYDQSLLQRCFKDVTFPFKKNFIIDLQKPEISKHHQYYARKALKKVHVEECSVPIQFLNEWLELYRVLVKKHNILGIRAFSRDTFAKLLCLPGLTMLRAIYNDTTVGAQLYLTQGDVVHCHLGVANEIGYRIGSVYALDWYSVEYFSGRAHWINLGGGLGVSGNKKDGLSQYKKGWASDTRTVYLCGRIFNNEEYTEILKTKKIAPTNYFPAYRHGEFL